MQRGVVIGMSLIAMGISGCAGTRTAQTVNRLQATVDLLDQRVTQLEQASVREVTRQPGLPAIAPVDLSAASQPKPAAPSSIKPSAKEIQQALKNAGFYQGQVDGKMGPLTREAIRQFQRVHGLSVDGIVGKKTWAQLAPYQDLSAESGELVVAEPLK